MPTSSFSESKLISQLFAPIAGADALGLLDDAALLSAEYGSELVLTVDTLVAGVHFFPDDPPGLIAKKSLRVNLSDLAAKGACPSGFLLAFSIPSEISWEWLSAFAKALGEDARAYKFPLLGGDTVRTPGPLTISVTALGRVPQGRMVKRTGAKSGDILAVTGAIGDAVLGLQIRLSQQAEKKNESWYNRLSPVDHEYLLQHYLLPQPRNIIADLLGEYAHGAMDISDGLIGDARKLLEASGISGVINLEKVPLSEAARVAIKIEPSLSLLAMTGGDDYEILCSVAPKRFSDFQRKCNELNVPVTAIGHTFSGGQELSILSHGKTIKIDNESYSHF